VFERMGHTEGSVDLMRIAGLKAGAALCELMNDDGSMTIGEDRVKFARRYDIPIISVEEILFFRIQNEDVLTERRKTKVMPWSDLMCHSFDFLGGTTVDTFYRINWQVSDKPTRITIACEDEALEKNLDILRADEADIVIMKSFYEKNLKTPAEHGIRQHAAICRTLQKLKVKNLASLPKDSELERIARTYFAINLI